MSGDDEEINIQGIVTDKEIRKIGKAGTSHHINSKWWAKFGYVSIEKVHDGITGWVFIVRKATDKEIEDMKKGE